MNERRRWYRISVGVPTHLGIERGFSLLGMLSPRNLPLAVEACAAGARREGVDPFSRRARWSCAPADYEQALAVEYAREHPEEVEAR